MTSRTTKQLQVFVGTPLSDEHARLIEALEPRVHLMLEQDLLPPMSRRVSRSFGTRQTPFTASLTPPPHSWPLQSRRTRGCAGCN